MHRFLLLPYYFKKTNEKGIWYTFLTFALSFFCTRCEKVIAFSSSLSVFTHDRAAAAETSSFLHHHPEGRKHKNHFNILKSVVSNNEEKKSSKENDDDGEDSSKTEVWAKYALLLSSFSEGVEESLQAQEFLKSSIAKVMLSQYINEKEEAVKKSVEFSPCAGPDIELLNSLEDADKLASSSSSVPSSDADKILKELSEKNDSEASPLSLRFLYIPTAMYALRSDSNNTPGKQRQRARADGKKRRTLIIKQLSDLFSSGTSTSGNGGIEISAVTLDLDDGSIKQPYSSNTEDNSPDQRNFPPKDGKEAFVEWKPHLIYVEGGNTFWLQHCIEKGNWSQYFMDSCTGDNASAVYCGKSAGAIVGGKLVETATFKVCVCECQNTYDTHET